MTRHPANRGQVMLSAWVSPEVRELVRREGAGDVSRWVETACRHLPECELQRRAVGFHSIEDAAQLGLPLDGYHAKELWRALEAARRERDEAQAELDRLRDVLAAIAAPLAIDGPNHAASVKHARDAKEES